MITDVSRRHEAAIEALAKVEAYAQTLHDPFLINRILTRQEAVSSSAIEGAYSTLDELLTQQETQDEDGRAQVRQVRQYAITLDSYVKRANQKGPEVFTSKLVGQLHARIMRNDPDYRDRPGKLRQLPVWIGSGDIAYSIFNPPPADRVPEIKKIALAMSRNPILQPA